MTKKEALEYFNNHLILHNKPSLKENYSDIELKKAYRSLSKIYHPDMYINNESEQKSAAEKMKKINSYYEELEKYVNKTPAKDLRTLRQEYLTKLKSFSSLNNSQDKLYCKIKNAIKKEITKYEPLLEEALTLSGLETHFKEFNQNIHKIYNKFIYDFCTQESIDINNVNEKINYDLNDYAFYQFLLSLKNKYSSLSKLEEVVLKHQNHNDYQFLSFRFNESLENAKRRVINDKKDINIVAEELTKEIESIITSYDFIITKIRALKALNKFNRNILNKITPIEEELSQGKSFETIIKELEDLDKFITEEKYNHNNKIIINDTYKQVIDKANSILKRIAPEDLNRFEDVRRTLDKVSAILRYIYDNNIKFNQKVLEKLTNLTFIDDEIDNDIINLVIASLNKIGNLYVTSNYNTCAICMVLEETKDTYKIACMYNTDIEIKTISKKSFNEDFIPLENFLTLSNLIWRSNLNNPNNYRTLLYRLNNISYLTLHKTTKDGLSLHTLEIMNYPNLNAFTSSPPFEIVTYKDPEVIKEKLFIEISEFLKVNENRSRH